MTQGPATRPSRISAAPEPGPAPRARAVLLGLLATAASTGIAVPCLLTALPALFAGPPAAVGPDQALVLVATALAGLVCLWLSLLFAVGTCSLLPGLVGATGRRLAQRLAPAVCARLTGSLLGAALLSATPPAALAVAPAAGTVAAERVSAAASVGLRSPCDTAEAAAGLAALSRQAPEPGWRPHRPAAPPVPERGSRLLATSPRPGWSPHADDEGVVVRRGDSLWTIAAEHLGPEATAGEIADEWPRWYAANRHLIGEDPGLILPGQVLVPPDVGNAGDAAPANPPDPSPRLGARR